MGATLREQFNANVVRWSLNPLLFAYECFGFKATEQQVALFIEITKLVWSKRMINLGFQESVVILGNYELTYDEQLLYVRKVGISIRAGKGTGKGSSIVMICLWFLTCFDKAKIPMTAPRFEQLQENVLGEFSIWMDQTDAEGNYKCGMRNLFTVLAKSVTFNDSPKFGVSIHVPAQNSDPEQMKATMQGKHCPYMLYVADEAAGINDLVFEPMRGTLTGTCNICLVTFNPSKNTGFAYETHRGDIARRWIPLVWNAEESPIVSAYQIEDMREDYGIHSQEYRYQVLGEFPESADTDLIPLSWLNEGIDRWLALELVEVKGQTWVQPFNLYPFPIQLGVDCAAGGKNKTVICIRQGPIVLGFVELDEADTQLIADRVLEVATAVEASNITVDYIGYGKGVYDRLKKLASDMVKSFDGNSSASNKDRFVNLRAEKYWELREDFEEDRACIPPHKRLKRELAALEWRDRNGKLLIIDKATLKKEKGIDSPDYADAYMYSRAIPDSRFLRRHRRRQQSKQVLAGFSAADTGTAGVKWMGA
jgi:phage terminase large subunit